MGKYIKVPNISFSSDNLGQATLKNTINDIGLGKTIIIPNVSFASNNLGKVHILGEYYFKYFTIESLQDNNTITAVKNSSGQSPTIYYSLNDGETWNNQTLSSGTITFGTINTGEKIIFKSTISAWATDWDKYNRFNGSKTFNVYGNAMSLLYGDDFVNNSEFMNNSTNNLTGLFYGTTNIIDASNLIIPSNTCKYNCYNGMFRGCTNLVKAPNLPATVSAEGCYSSMFEGCINLEVAPELNLKTLSVACCKRMFCMNRSAKITTPKMTKSPILRVKTGVKNCYEEMFKGNGNLIEITCLLENDSSSTLNWLVNASSTGTFYKSPLKTNWQTNTSNIPTGWTIIDYVEE